jgi:hypothetical protein
MVEAVLFRLPADISPTVGFRRSWIWRSVVDTPQKATVKKRPADDDPAGSGDRDERR